MSWDFTAAVMRKPAEPLATESVGYQPGSSTGPSPYRCPDRSPHLGTTLGERRLDEHAPEAIDAVAPASATPAGGASTHIPSTS